MAIEAKEFTEKDELIAKFYTLRAGLSAVAEETKQIREQEKKKRELIRLDAEHRKEVEGRLASKKRELEENMQPNINNIGNSLYEERKEHTKQSQELNRLNSPGALRATLHNVHLGGWWILIIICSLAWFGTLIFEIITPENVAALDESKYLIAGWGISLVIAIILGNLLRLLIANVKLKKQRRLLSVLVDEKRRNISDLQRRYDMLVQEKARKEKMIDNMANAPDDADYFADLYKDDLQKAEEHIQTEVIPVHTARAQDITRALHQQFDSILTEADWENVDLLIFYLNTGRADSLKEALQLVDRQRQTDQIRYAIRDAYQHIASTMRDNTYRLAKVMTGCFHALSDQIQQNHSAMMAGIQQTNEALSHLSGSVHSLDTHMQSLSSGIESQNQTLLEANELNAALLNQAHRSSRDLMYELRYNQEYWK